MPRDSHERTWYVVADVHSAMVLASDRRGAPPRPIWSGVHVQRHGSATANQHPRGGSGEYDPYEDEVRDWARDLADFLGEARHRRHFDRALLIADPAILGELRACLDPPTAHLVAACYESYLLTEESDSLPERLLAFDDRSP